MAKMKPGLYYFCHPYSAETKEGRIANYELCCRRSAKLLLKGYNIFSPIVHSHSIEMASPEMLKWPIEDRYKFWLYNIDFAILEFVNFTGAIFAPDWMKSRGCTKEYMWFVSHLRANGKSHRLLVYNNIVGG